MFLFKKEFAVLRRIFGEIFLENPSEKALVTVPETANNFFYGIVNIVYPVP